MRVTYCFSAEKMDIPVGPEEMAMPLKVTPAENHPFFTLGDYFDSIRFFLLESKFLPFISLLRESLNKHVGIDDILNIVIRSEKSGAFYHLASVEVLSQGPPIRYSVSSAVSEIGKSWLHDEFEMLVSLENLFGATYIPRAFFKGEVTLQIGSSEGSFSMFLSEWFQDYHEWHFTFDEQGNQQICIWDLENGYRNATKLESNEIIRLAARILTLFYDTRTFEQIWPWHHAAGDFIVKTEHGITDVKLTTARRYERVMYFTNDNEINPVVSLLYFFLTLTIKIRLDKVDGIGEVAWAGDFSLEAAVRGFFESLCLMEGEGRYHLGRVEDFLGLFKAFSKDELARLFSSQLGFYEMWDPADFKAIETNLNDHVDALYRVIQNFNLF